MTPAAAPLPGRRRVSPRNGGRALVAGALALLVLSAAAVVAVPWWKDSAIATQAGATAADLKRFAEAFKQYAHDRGDWPPAAAPAATPAGIASALPIERWAQATPIGGHYTWTRESLQRGTRLQAAIVITGSASSPVTTDRRVLTEIDRLIDDANLDTGRFRLGFRLQPVVVLEF